MSAIDTAMILAAGKGSRMAPLTDSIPKPLVPVAGQPLIAYALAQVAAAGMPRCILNVHHLADQMQAYVAGYPGPLALAISDERDCLRETGGGVVHALPLIARDTLVVLNADNIWLDRATPAIRQLLDQWQPDDMDVLLLLSPAAQATGYDGAGDFYLAGDAAGPATPDWRGARPAAPYVFAGIHVLKTSLLAGRTASPFAMTDIWRTAMAADRCRAVVHDGRWLHVGTPDGIGAAEQALAERSR